MFVQGLLTFNEPTSGLQFELELWGSYSLEQTRLHVLKIRLPRRKMREVYALFLAIDYQVLLHQHKHLQNEYFPNQLRGRSSTAVIQSSGLQESLRSKATEHQILVQKEEQITKAQIAERKALMKKKRQLKKKGENLEAKDVIRLEELEVLFKKMQKAKKRITDGKSESG